MRGVDRAKDQSLLPLHAGPGAARARDVPGRRARQGRRPRAGARSSACRSPRSRTARRSASSRTASTPLRRAPAAPRRAGGTIRTSRASVLGRHDGVHRFTVGQRKGLGLASGDPALRRRHRRRRRRRSPSARARRSSGRRCARRGVNWIAARPPRAEHARHARRSATATSEAAATITPARTRRVEVDVRRAAERHHAGTGGRLLRRRGRARWRWIDSEGSLIAEVGSLTSDARAIAATRPTSAFAEVLRQSFEILLGVDRGHAA